MNSGQTIISLATPMGTGALSVIRCSGESTEKIIQTFFKKKFIPRYAHYAKFKKNEIVIDDVVAIYYPAPNSYTGEDMLEITCHGGPVMYQLLIREILNIKNCRLAKAGEFSERAFLNNKISLIEAESICALIKAKTEEAALAARETLSGKFSKELFEIDNNLLKIRVQIEAMLDFSEEDIETKELNVIEQYILVCKNKIINLINKIEKNNLLHEVSKLVIIGKSNAGKSSLINCLTGEQISIVNKVAGTTRDVVSKMFSLKGIPIIIFDTAGIRETEDLVEKEGKERALKQAELATLILYVYDASIGINNEDLEILKNLKIINSNILIIANKIDLLTKDNLSILKKEMKDNIFISIKKNIFIENLKNKIIENLNIAISNYSPGIIQIKNLNHLKLAFKEIESINISLSELELIAEKLKITQVNLAMILDNNDEDRILSGIFSNFCIGK